MKICLRRVSRKVESLTGTQVPLPSTELDGESSPEMDLDVARGHARGLFKLAI